MLWTSHLYLWFVTWLVRQKLVHFVEESRLLLWCGISRFGAFIFVASIGAYQGVNSCLACSYRRLCLHSLQLEDVLQFLAIQAFFLSMILTGAGYSRIPTFQVTGGFLCAPKHFHEFSFLLNTVLDVLC